MYNNPYVYSDPTGMISINEVNASEVINKILDAIQARSKGQVSKQAINKAKGVVTDIAKDALSKLVPTYGYDIADTLPDFGKGGNVFEDALIKILCPILSSVYPSWLWLEPRVSPKGMPDSDGFGCGVVDPDDLDNSLGLGRSSARKGKNTKGYLRPDFIIKSDGGPYTTDHVLTSGKGSKSWLIGDMKIALRSAYSDVKKKDEQWMAMVNYAKFRNKHQFAGVGLYITYFDGPEHMEKYIRKTSLKRGVLMESISILPVKLS
jgi:hypothetical protein